MKKLAFMITCYDEVNAIDIATTSLRHYYPDAPVFLFCEGDSLLFEGVCKRHKINMGVGEDTQSPLLKLWGENYPAEAIPNVERAINVFLNRVAYCCDESNNAEYLLLHCPDTLIRGKIDIPEGAGLLGSRVNNYFKQETNQVLVKHGGIPLNCFGAVPAIFNIQDFYKAYHIMTHENPNLVRELAESWLYSFSHDIITPILFSLIGKEEEFNPQTIHCELNFSWMKSTCPIVHQFRTFYPQRKTKYKSQET